MGPTASGKTEIAARLYEQIDCELISVDAAQVYRGMNVGTAKPDADFLKRYPHHLIDIRGVLEPYSAAEFLNDASCLISDICARGKLPVLVGGTMFYFSTLENGLSSLPQSDPEIRDQIFEESVQGGLNKLYQELKRADPETAAKIKPGDTQRIHRAVELLRITGLPPVKLMTRTEKPLDHCRIMKCALFSPNRSTLHERIAKRFHSMLESGLIEEVRTLTEGLKNPEQYPAFRSVGYRQVLEFLNNKYDREAMIDAGIASTRQLAKRQLTWLRNQSNVIWFENLQKDLPNVLLESIQPQN